MAEKQYLDGTPRHEQGKQPELPPAELTRRLLKAEEEIEQLRSRLDKLEKS